MNDKIKNFLNNYPVFVHDKIITYWMEHNCEIAMYTSNIHDNGDIFDKSNQWEMKKWKELYDSNKLITSLSIKNQCISYQLVDEHFTRENGFFEENFIVPTYNIKRQTGNINNQRLVWDFFYPLNLWRSILWKDAHLNVKILQENAMGWYNTFKMLKLPKAYSHEQHMLFHQIYPDFTHHDVAQFYTQYDYQDYILL